MGKNRAEERSKEEICACLENGPYCNCKEDEEDWSCSEEACCGNKKEIKVSPGKNMDEKSDEEFKDLNGHDLGMQFKENVENVAPGDILDGKPPIIFCSEAMFFRVNNKIWESVGNGALSVQVEDDLKKVIFRKDGMDPEMDILLDYDPRAKLVDNKVFFVNLDAAQNPVIVSMRFAKKENAQNFYDSIAIKK